MKSYFLILIGNIMLFIIYKLFIEILIKQYQLYFYDFEDYLKVLIGKKTSDW